MRTILITGGKGGVGKTNIAINLAMSLASRSQKVLLLDADFGLANVDVLLDLNPKITLTDVIEHQMPLQDAIISNVNGVDIIPAGSGNPKMANLSYIDISSLIDRVNNLDNKPNTLIIDTAAGISESVLGLSMIANEVMIVVCNEPTSITDAYALIKLLNTRFGVNKFRIVANKVRKNEESIELFAKLTKVADKFLNVSLQLVASIPEDTYMERSVRRRKAVVSAYPTAKSSVAIGELANKALQWPIPERITGRVSASVE